MSVNKKINTSEFLSGNDLSIDKFNDCAHSQAIEYDNSDSTPEMLYVAVRRNLNKVYRVSRSTLPIPQTPSKGGVIVETTYGKFNEIKARFDQKLFNHAMSGSKIFTCNNFGRKFINRIFRGKSKPIDVSLSDESNTSSVETTDNSSFSDVNESLP